MIVRYPKRKNNNSIHVFSRNTDCSTFVKKGVFLPGKSFFNFNSLFIIKVCLHILPLSGPNKAGNSKITRSLFIAAQIIPTVEL